VWGAHTRSTLLLIDHVAGTEHQADRGRDGDDQRTVDLFVSGLGRFTAANAMSLSRSDQSTEVDLEGSVQI
jgi:hypothetical protein